MSIVAPAYRRVAKFAVVGLLSNVLLYGVYLGLTHVGLGPKTAVVIVFCLGVVQTFVANRWWTFRDLVARRGAFVRYWLAYAGACALDLGLIAVFVDGLGYPHEVVQGILVIVIAALLFVAQRFWVFGSAAVDGGAAAGAGSR